MYEYIKRTDAIAEINRGDLLVGNNAEWAREIIWRTPYADVVQVKHACWDSECRCTACDWYGEDWYKHDAIYFRYCPHCGSRMDGGISNE